MNVAIGGAFALAGVVIGAVLAGIVELWRQVLNGRAAARIVRMEIQENAVRCKLYIKAGPAEIERTIQEVKLLDDAWKDLRVQLAPMLTDEALVGISTRYGALFIVEYWMRQFQTNLGEARSQVKQWLDGALIDAALLKQVEARPRLAQFIDLLMGRATWPPPKSQADRVTRGNTP